MLTVAPDAPPHPGACICDDTAIVTERACSSEHDEHLHARSDVSEFSESSSGVRRPGAMEGVTSRKLAFHCPQHRAELPKGVSTWSAN